MYYNLEILDRNGKVVKTFNSLDKTIVLKEYAQAMQYYYKKKNNYSPVIKSCKCNMIPYTDEKEWRITITFDDGVIHSVYKYYFNLKED